MRRTLGRFTSLTVVATTAVFLACEESPTSLDSQGLSAEAAELSSHAGNPVVLSARGSGHSEGPGIGGSEVGWRTFSFSAVMQQDGTAEGHLQYDVHGEGFEGSTTRQHGRVICMAVSSGSPRGDIVLIGLEATRRFSEREPTNNLGLPQPNEPPFNNHGILFTVRDNGEGSNATGPDQFTGVVHTQVGIVELACADPEFLSPGPGIPAWAVAESFFNDVEAGNIQVSP
jgi:hypothetical protein